MTPPQPAKTPGEAIDRALSIVERQFTSAADAMPEDKYSFAPTSGEFKGVRTFAQQVKHVASANYFFASGILEEKPPVDPGGENGPDSLKSKSEIMKFLNDSFAYLHKAPAELSEKNQLIRLQARKGGQEDNPAEHGHILGGASPGPLWADGRIPAHERDRSAGEPPAEPLSCQSAVVRSDVRSSSASHGGRA
jgi:hypothetical protein